MAPFDRGKLPEETTSDKETHELLSHEKLLEIANDLSLYEVDHPELSSNIEPILQFIGAQLKEHSPESPKCTATLSQPVPCDDFRKTLSYSMCLAWKKLETGETKRMSEAMKQARSETFAECRRRGVAP
jgi:hypothetical protein